MSYFNKDKTVKGYDERFQKRFILHQMLLAIGFTRDRAKAICEEARKIMGG